MTAATTPVELLDPAACNRAIGDLLAGLMAMQPALDAAFGNLPKPAPAPPSAPCSRNRVDRWRCHCGRGCERGHRAFSWARA